MKAWRSSLFEMMTLKRFLDVNGRTYRHKDFVGGG